MTSDGSGRLLLASEQQVDSYNDEYKVHLINPVTGYQLWTSMPLIGRINSIEVLNDSSTGKKRIAVSTSSAVYISR